MREFWRRDRPDGSPGGVYWTNLLGRRVSTGCKDLRTAQIWKRAREREAADPRLAAAKGARLDDAIRDILAELKRRGASAATLKKNAQKLGHFPRLWGAGMALVEVDAARVNAYVGTRLLDPGSRKGTTLSRLTVRDELVALRQLLTLARREGRFHAHPDDVLPIRFEAKYVPRADWVRPYDLAALLARVERRHAAHLLFFVCTGGRLSDAARSLRSDWDLKKLRVVVRGSKTDGSFRTIPIPDFIVPFAKRLLGDAEGEDVLFMPWGNINRDLKAACVRAGIQEVSTNGLRRTFGHMLRLHGYSLDIISKLFGHTTEKLARDVYANVEGDELAAAMAASRQSAGQSRVLFKNGTSANSQKLKAK